MREAGDLIFDEHIPAHVVQSQSKEKTGGLREVNEVSETYYTQRRNHLEMNELENHDSFETRLLVKRDV